MRFLPLRRIVAVVWALGVLLVLPAAAQAGFEEPIKVTPSGADPFSNPAAVGFDRSGETTVETVSAGHVLLYTRPSGGSFSESTIGAVSGSGPNASMAVSAGGAAVIAWRESLTTVQVDYRASSSGTFGPAATFSGGSAVENVAAGIDANGNAVVAWKDGAIHVALSTGASFGSAEVAPLGASLGFEGRGGDAQRDHGPRAFRDDAGNVILAYRDGANATVAHRAPGGEWDEHVLSTSATDLQADADPTSQRLIVGFTTTGEFLAFEGSTSSSTGTTVVKQPASTSNIMSVAMQRGGSVDAVFWSGASNELLSASDMNGFAPETVAPSVSEGVLGAVTSGSDLIAYIDASPGLERASRTPGGAWTSTPFEVSNYGTLAVGAGYNCDALGMFVDFPADTGVTGFPYSGTDCGSPPPPAAAAARPAEAKRESPPGPPRLGVNANVARVSGTVLLRLPGTSRFVPLSQVRQIPLGTVIEATHGRVSVTAARAHGGTQTGEFFEGQFRLTQGRNGLVVATLTGGNFSVCPTARERSHQARASSAHTSGKHVVRKLWANAHGKFSTKGNYAAGAVQGTEWLTEDLCDGTLIKVTRDKVAVTNLVNHRHVEVTTGRHYLAKAP